MAKTVLQILNAALKELGEPEITALDTTNILQERLLEGTNNAVRELVDRIDYKWRLKRTILVTTDDVTTGSAAVTNGSATVTSVDSDGADAQNFTNVSAGMYFRVTATQKSYLIDSVDNTSDPHTLTLENAYLDTTSTATGYRIFQDTYAISTSGFGELVEANYGDAATWMGGGIADNELVVKNFTDLQALAGGDRHRDTSGRPRVIAQIGPDSSDNQQFVLWPFPTDDYLIELWYAADFTSLTAITDTPFGADAPPSAYDYVEHKVCSLAHMWDENFQKAAAFEQMANNALANVLRREHREQTDVAMGVETYRRSYGGRYPVRSGRLFDTVYRRR